ncbi:MAG: 50S ribosomal protein L7/L12, partial [Candidatus Colwellbacteria bacterium]|nr:50S ribosomal protein L7/L12 [Candidatus Colwellbacteria bacterium]
MEKEKLIEEIEKLSVVELAELVKAMEEKFGITAAAPVSGAVAGGEAAEEKTAFTVVLTAAGDQKINVIKA